MDREMAKGENERQRETKSAVDGLLGETDRG